VCRVRVSEFSAHDRKRQPKNLFSSRQMMSVPRLFLSALRRAWWNFKVLGDAPRELWITTVFVRILLAFSYFSLASMLVAIEEFDFGFSDGKSMRIFGFWGLCISGFSLTSPAR